MSGGGDDLKLVLSGADKPWLFDLRAGTDEIGGIELRWQNTVILPVSCKRVGKGAGLRF